MLRRDRPALGKSRRIGPAAQAPEHTDTHACLQPRLGQEKGLQESKMPALLFKHRSTPCAFETSSECVRTKNKSLFLFLPGGILPEAIWGLLASEFVWFSSLWHCSCLFIMLVGILFLSFLSSSLYFLDPRTLCFSVYFSGT